MGWVGFLAWVLSLVKNRYLSMVMESEVGVFGSGLMTMKLNGNIDDGLSPLIYVFREGVHVGQWSFSFDLCVS
jgi:hypothetical protein